ncbi:ribosome biogenesis protein BMS1 homolog [Penaeus monodon]|uniref:ribosome biogenesis protein BMS1 homolog n=1 Tax=Penaeus monodon TaxID=6687 RepID=UPI0018A79E68|nr:ribosome biogenesis protein BMS1 homolog [Penaeus monodon]
MAEEIDFDKKKAHKKRHAGRKAEKKAEKNKHVQDLTAKQRNPKAFAFHSAVKAQRTFVRSQDIKAKKHHIPVVDRAPLEPPPVVVAVVGGPKVGKSTLLRCLIKNYTNQRLSEINGPVTIVAGKKKKLTFIEVNNDINCMIDIAKVADIVLILIDATFGIEMEVFEFLEICRAHGSPRIMGILNHLDMMKDNKVLKKKKKTLKHRFQIELYPGAKLFFLSGIIHGEYLKNEIKNLSRFISVMKFRPLTWRSTHPYVIVEFGFAGCGDFRLKDVSFLPDPCPLPEQLKKRSLNAKERLIYAPMSGVGGVVYDKDAVYIDLGGSHHGNKNKAEDDDDEEDEGGVLEPLLNLQKTADEKQAESQIKLFSNTQFISLDKGETEVKREEGEVKMKHFQDSENKLPSYETVKDSTGRIRRRVIFHDNSTLSSGSKTKDIRADSDSDDCDVDSDLKDIVRGLEKDQANIDVKEIKLKVGIKGSDRDKKTVQALKRNKDFEMTAKIQGILEKISTASGQQPKPNLAGSDCGSGSEISRMKELKKEESIHQVEGMEEEKMDYRTEMFKQATQNFYKNQNTVSYLKKYIYGQVKEEKKAAEEEVEDHIGGLFLRVSKPKSGMSRRSSQANMDELDTSRYIPPVLRDWSSSELLESIRDCFMTGEWKDDKNAESLLKLDDEDEDLYGDFEDLETGQKFSAPSSEDIKEGKSGKDIDENVVPEVEKEKTKREKLLEKKRRLKEMFDSEYDGKDDGDHFDTLKAELSQQAQLNRSEFEGLDEETRVQYEGFRAGMYVRLEFTKFPCEFITNFDSSYPVIVGGLLDNESNMGFVRVRIKVHRWYPRILKNKDPLILSLGWRRFQTLMYYAKREDNFVMRSLKYARKYLHVEAMFWGPVTTIGTGFVALQNIAERVSEFRIAANGVVLETDQSCKIVKKLRLLGTPEKIVQKTAFVKDMFHTETEIAKFVGAKVQTQSGIRGILKKAHGHKGLFRATFEDIIKMSDVIVLKTWVPLVLTQYCSTMRTLLLSPKEKAEWQGMRTVAQIKKAKGIKNEVNPDHLYTPITQRRDYVPLPLKVPKALQKDLPYNMKPKVTPKSKKVERVVVVKDPHEVEMDDFMKRLKVMMEDKLQKEKKEMLVRKKKFIKENADKELKRKMRESRKKKAACRILGKKAGKKSVV